MKNRRKFSIFISSIYLQIYMAVFFITGRALRGSALFLFPDQKTTCWKRTRKT